MFACHYVLRSQEQTSLLCRSSADLNFKKLYQMPYTVSYGPMQIMKPRPFNSRQLHSMHGNR